MRVLICGSRDWTEAGPIRVVLEGVLHLSPVRGRPPRHYRELTVIEGCCPTGADKVACLWRPDLDHEHYPADWKRCGNAAGFIRNQQMLDEGRPDVVFAFKSHFDWTLSQGGTEDMVRRARDAGVPVRVMQSAW